MLPHFPDSVRMLARPLRGTSAHLETFSEYHHSRVGLHITCCRAFIRIWFVASLAFGVLSEICHIGFAPPPQLAHASFFALTAHFSFVAGIFGTEAPSLLSSCFPYACISLAAHLSVIAGVLCTVLPHRQLFPYFFEKDYRGVRAPVMTLTHTSFTFSSPFLTTT